MRRRHRTGLLPVVLASGCLVFFSGCLFSTRGHQGPATRHFDGDRFRHPWQSSTPNQATARVRERSFLPLLAALIRWRLGGPRTPWPEWVDDAPGDAPPPRVHRGFRVTFINHATVLVQTAGLNVLTDPIWSERAGPLSWAGVRRHRAPGLRFEDLPPIDLVLISHNHYDHLDLSTLERLSQTHLPKIAVGLGVGDLLERRGIRRVREFDWETEVPLGPGRSLVAVPVQHFSMRGLFDRNTSLWTGYVLKTPEGRLYFPGDTGYGPHFKDTADRHGPIDIALLPIGAYRPRWFMRPVHIDPAEAVQAHLDLGAAKSLGIHFGTFQQSDEGIDEPIADLARARSALGVADDAFITLAEGAHFTYQRRSTDRD